MDKITLGLRIRKQRKNLGLTLEKFAGKVELSRNYIAEIERGKKMPRLNTFIKIVNGLNISSDEVLKDEVICARPHMDNEIYEMTKNLPPNQLKVILDVIEVIVKNINKIS